MIRKYLERNNEIKFYTDYVDGVPYEELPKEQQTKDALFVAVAHCIYCLL